MRKEAMKLALEALAVKFSEGWHEGIKIDASDIMLLNDAAQALAKPDFWEGYVPEPVKPAQPVAMRMPKVGDEVVCIEDESLGVVAYLTAGGSPEIRFDDGSHGTYVLREFAELFRYTSPPAQRTWVGLVWGELPEDGQNHDFLRGAVWAETKLKEKNQ